YISSLYRKYNFITQMPALFLLSQMAATDSKRWLHRDLWQNSCPYMRQPMPRNWMLQQMSLLAIFAKQLVMSREFFFFIYFILALVPSSQPLRLCILAQPAEIVCFYLAYDQQGRPSRRTGRKKVLRLPPVLHCQECYYIANRSFSSPAPVSTKGSKHLIIFTDANAAGEKPLCCLQKLAMQLTNAVCI
ncbi:unnamed protein product, partial [Heterosigma akashiwo]